MVPTDEPSPETGRPFPSRTTDVVRAHWQNLRHGHALPHRDAIDPRKINGVLDQVVLIERSVAGKATFRVSGMAINAITAKELRGMPFENIFVPHDRFRLGTLMRALFERPSILSMQLSADNDTAQPSLLARMQFFPLQGPRGSCDLAIGGIDLKRAMGTAPRHFKIERALSEPLQQPGPRRPAGLVARPNLVLLDFETQ